jgi:hypothetical protein
MTMSVTKSAPTAGLDAASLQSPKPILDADAGTVASDPTAALTIEERQQLAVRVLADALLLGIVGDALLRVSSWGANFTLWSLGIVAAVLTLARRRHETLPASAWIAAPAAVLGLMFIWRDSAELAVYNALALAATLALLSMSLTRGPAFSVVGSRVRDLVEGAVRLGIGTVFGMLPLVFSDVSFRDVANNGTKTRIVAGVRAALIAIPLLLLFGGLFASADPVFARIAADVFQVDAELIASHLALFGVISWLVGGFLRATIIGPIRGLPTLRVPEGALGLTEVSVALGSLVLLFAAFVAVQLRYFFGGDALVQVTAGLSYADYARRGFFELVAVSALVLPVLLSANVLLRRENRAAEQVYRSLSFTLLGLLGIIMYSAVARMRLYQGMYGYSIDRLYATVFMAWLAVVFAWFAVTVLRGREKRFLAGVVASAWGFLAALNVGNPAAFVARANIARAAQGKELDVRYLANLGADAAPALTRYLTGMPLTPPFAWPRAQITATDTTAAARAQQERSWMPYVTSRDDYTARCYAARGLLSKWGPSAEKDWRSWTFGRAAAQRVVASNSARLTQLAHLAPSGQELEPCPTPEGATAPSAVDSR